MIAQDEMWEDREDRSARGALYPPDGQPAQPDTGVMGVARQAPATATGRFMCELKAKAQEKGEDEFNKGPAIAEQVSVGRFIVEIDGDGTVLPCLCGCCGQVITPTLSGLVSA